MPKWVVDTVAGTAGHHTAKYVAVTPDGDLIGGEGWSSSDGVDRVSQQTFGYARGSWHSFSEVVERNK